MGKEEVKLSLFDDVMIPCTSDPKNSTGEFQFLQLINTFNKVTGKKINANNDNITKTVASLYTNVK